MITMTMLLAMMIAFPNQGFMRRLPSLSGISPSLVLFDPRVDQLPHEVDRQGLVGRDADGPLAGVVLLELFLVGFHRRTAHEVEGAVARGRAEAHEHSVLTEGGELVADALLSLRRRSLDGLPQSLERGSLVVAQGCEVLVDGPWSCLHRS